MILLNPRRNIEKIPLRASLDDKPLARSIWHCQFRLQMEPQNPINSSTRINSHWRLSVLQFIPIGVMPLGSSALEALRPSTCAPHSAPSLHTCRPRKDHASLGLGSSLPINLVWLLIAKALEVLARTTLTQFCGNSATAAQTKAEFSFRSQIHARVSEIRGVPYSGPDCKGILLFWGSIFWGPLYFRKPPCV